MALTESMQVLAPVEIRLAQDRLRMRTGEFVEVRQIIRMRGERTDHQPTGRRGSGPESPATALALFDEP